MGSFYVPLIHIPLRFMRDARLRIKGSLRLVFCLSLQLSINYFYKNVKKLFLIKFAATRVLSFFFCIFVRS